MHFGEDKICQWMRSTHSNCYLDLLPIVIEQNNIEPRIICGKVANRVSDVMRHENNDSTKFVLLLNSYYLTTG